MGSKEIQEIMAGKKIITEDEVREYEIRKEKAKEDDKADQDADIEGAADTEEPESSDKDDKPLSAMPQGT